MVNISLKLVPIETPDAERRVKSAWRILAEMVLDQLVEVERDDRENPAVDLPLATAEVSSQSDYSKVLEV